MPPLAHPGWQQGRRGHQHHLGAERAQQCHVRSSHPAVQDVADNHHPPALDIAEALPDGERVEKCLGGVFVRAVPGIHHAGSSPESLRSCPQGWP